MSEHFIKTIEIKNFKCFEDFKAEGFGRVNLIGGKNNVGKTAFMEACFLSSIDKDSKKFIENSIVIELHRNSLDFILEWISDYSTFELHHLNSEIYVNNDFIPVILTCTYGQHKPNEAIMLKKNKAEEFFKSHLAKEYDFSVKILQNKNFDNLNSIPNIEILKTFFKKNSPPLIKNHQFVSVGNNFNNYLVDFIDEVKLLDREEELNKALSEFFDIKKIDIIKNQVMLKKESKYFVLSEFGDGVKHFLNIILALYLNKDNILYLDEIENGIHYTNLDRLWEIILTLSKQQNVQVFATTHSKECIESYARVTKKLEDEKVLQNEDTKYIELFKDENQIKTMVLSRNQLDYQLKQNHEVR